MRKGNASDRGTAREEDGRVEKKHLSAHHKTEAVRTYKFFPDASSLSSIAIAREADHNLFLLIFHAFTSFFARKVDPRLSLSLFRLLSFRTLIPKPLFFLRLRASCAMWSVYERRHAPSVSTLVRTLCEFEGAEAGMYAYEV